MCVCVFPNAFPADEFENNSVSEDDSHDAEDRTRMHIAVTIPITYAFPWYVCPERQMSAPVCAQQYNMELAMGILPDNDIE